MGIFTSVEKRKATRVSFRGSASYRLEGNGADWEKAQILECSLHGVRLSIEREFPVGQQLLLKLPTMAHSFQLTSQVPSFRPTTHFEAEGEIVWVKPSQGQSSSFECGIRLLKTQHLPGREGFIGFIADKLCELALLKTKGMDCFPAQSFEDLQAAYRLLYREYAVRGYCEINPAQMHYSHFAVLPDTRTFILKKRNELLGTISLIGDSPCGFPLEGIFPEEISRLRAEGRRLAEVGLLALDSHRVGRSHFSLAEVDKLSTLFRLFKVMFDYARCVGGVTDLVIGMHPKHATLYRYLTFESLGPVRSYPGACGKPALLMRMDIRRSEETFSAAPGKGAYFSKNLVPREILERHYRWTPESVRELLIDARPLWPKLSPTAQEYLKSCYPEVSR